MITRERIEALRAPHEIRTRPDGLYCLPCLHSGSDHSEWPCDTYAALTLALEAETLRTALEICADIGETRVAVVARAALGGDS